MAKHSGAVQLFVQTARAVKSSFELTVDNAADVVAICRELDGLPLAIELAAARSKLLSPHALLARLGSALDLKGSAVGRPTRQHTLRETIAWSYQLLTDHEQALFRRLGVFVGGADLAAIGVVCGDILHGEDPLNVVADLVEANLSTITEDTFGEPRIGMLVTIRAYALEQLTNTGELAWVQRRHADCYLEVAEDLWGLRAGPHQDQARRRFEVELDNFRDALTWAFITGNKSPGSDRTELGRLMCKALSWCWLAGGYLEEAGRWLERCVELPSHGEELSLLLSDNLFCLADVVRIQGDLGRALSLAKMSLEVARVFGTTRELVNALHAMGFSSLDSGDEVSARAAFEEAADVASRIGDPLLIANSVLELAVLEGALGNYDRSIQLDTQALSMFEDIGDAMRALTVEGNLIVDLAWSGDVTGAYRRSLSMIPRILASRDPMAIARFAANPAESLLDVDLPEGAARLMGAADALLARLGVKLAPAQEAEHQDFQHKCKNAIGAEDFQRLYDAGRATMVEDLLPDLQDS